MLARAGERNAKSAAARIAALETRIANYQWTKVQNRDPVKTYNPMSLPEYQKLAPGFDWLAFFDGMGTPPQRMDINQPSFINGIGQLVKTVPVSDWRLYFKFQLLDDYAPALSKEMTDHRCLYCLSRQLRGPFLDPQMIAVGRRIPLTTQLRSLRPMPSYSV